MPLTDTSLRNAKGAQKPYKWSDGGGLFVLVNIDGRRYWRLAYRFGGKQKTLALGIYPLVSLQAARKARDVAKEQLASGVDPSNARKRAKWAAKLSAQNSFEKIALEWCEKQQARWTPKYARCVLRRLQLDVFPQIGSRPIAEIEAPELLDVLCKVEARGALDITKRLRETCGQIFRYAIITGRAVRDPAADLKGALKTAPRVVHRRAMPREHLPGFLHALNAYDGAPTTGIALKLVVLTFVRTKELRPARWHEFQDLNGSAPLWRIPAERMKMGREHIVPLAHQVVAVLSELRRLTGDSPYLFPSSGKTGFMSENTMLYALYRMGYHSRATVHGFRGVASTILNEAGFSCDWIERQLAHDESNKVRGAYNSAQYLSDRRTMMQWYADYLDGLVNNI